MNSFGLPTHTCWYRVTEEGLKYNHLADGYDAEADEPTPRDERQQAAWANALWESRAAHMDGIRVIEHQPCLWLQGTVFRHHICHNAPFHPGYHDGPTEALTESNRNLLSEWQREIESRNPAPTPLAQLRARLLRVATDVP